MSGNSISKKAYDEMKEKLDYLKTTKRQEIIQAIKEAREAGDLRENAGYHEARKDQSMNESIITELEGKLRNAEVREEKSGPKDKVVFGCKVKIKNIANDDEMEFTVVSEIEANIFEHKISTDSPLGEALFQCKLGDVVEVDAPDGIIKYKILEIC